MFEGVSFGAEAAVHGEVVFNTSMAGYQEILTDPSYAGQIVVLTYPLCGNYGINEHDFESSRIQVSGFVVREDCLVPSHWQSERTLHRYLADAGVPGIQGIDTRQLTRCLRSAGVMMGMLSDMPAAEALAELRRRPRYDHVDFVRSVSTSRPYQWEPVPGQQCVAHIVVLDCGLKYNILRILRGLGCAVTAVPCTYTADEIIALKPDGIVLSPGPGDPMLLDYVVENVKRLVQLKPVMGICLGEQLIGRAFGARTFKLKFGHRGGNQPVKDLCTGRVYITAQNHGYAVDADSVAGGLEVSHVNLNDGTVEGLRHRDLPVFSIQYHSEASPGPHDSMYLFNEFLDLVRAK